MLCGGLNLIGPFLVEEVDTLPTWTPNDKRRLIYSNLTNRIYLGTSTSFKDITGSGDILLDADTVDGIHASTTARANTLLALDANMQLPASALMLNGHMSSTSPSAGYIPVMNSEGKVNASITGDAATLGGEPSSSYVRTNSDSIIDQHKLTIVGSQGQMNASAGSVSALEIKPITSSTDPALISFNRTGVFSCFFGLDTDNLFKYGGLSLGGNKYKFWTENNMGHSSGLNADTTDTFHASATPTPNYLLALDANGLFPKEAIPNGVGLPVGALVMFPMGYPSSTIPSDYLSCRGQSISTTTYADLFDYLGYYYGGSSGSFNVPDYRGYFLRMVDCGIGNDPNATTRTPAVGGVAQGVGSKQSDIIKIHNHPLGYNSGKAAGGESSTDPGGWNVSASIPNVYSIDSYASPDTSQRWALVPQGSETRPINVYIEIGIKWR